MKLQTPQFVYMGGGLRSWDEATLHVGSEAATRGLSVLEGVKCYRHADGSLAVVMLRQHFERLKASARMLHTPFDSSLGDYQSAISELVDVLEEPERDMWLRTTLFVTQVHWGEGTAADLVITGYQADQMVPKAVDLGVSTWRRSDDVSLPARIKTGTNYQVGRLARIEGRANGYEDMVLLNHWGRVGRPPARVFSWFVAARCTHRRRRRGRWRASRSMSLRPWPRPWDIRSSDAPSIVRNCWLQTRSRCAEPLPN